MPAESREVETPAAGAEKVSKEKDRSDKVEKSEKTGKSEKAEKTEKSSKTEKAEKAEKSSKPDKAEKSEKAAKTDKDDKKEKTVKNDRSPKTSREKNADKSDKPDKAPSRNVPVATTTAPRNHYAKPGLSEDAQYKVAQAKFEAQEEKLKEVARFAMVLLRDYQKLGASECTKKVAELRKALLKYEMQYLRVCELQERRRKVEITGLEAEAHRCREDAEKEASRIVELREVLETERRRRKRYEGYELAAAEVNVKKSRVESQEEIDRVTSDIAHIRQKRIELDTRIEERSRRAQLLRHAAAELVSDLRQEQEQGSLIDNITSEPVGSPDDDGPGKAVEGIIFATGMEVIS